MHKDFHLYGTYLAARLAGFDKNAAGKIACAAQAVDDFTYGEYGSCQTDKNMAATIRQEAKDILQTLWTTFHFLPADIDNDALNTTPKLKYRTAPRGILYDNLSRWLHETFQSAVSPENNLARAGVTMHVLADTYAHEGFSGVIDNENTVKNVKTDLGGGKVIDLGVIFGSFHLPTWIGKIIDAANIGHGTAGHFPDISWITYQYERDAGHGIVVRNNPEIFSEAFVKMAEILNAAGSIQNNVGNISNNRETWKQSVLSQIQAEKVKKIQEYDESWFIKSDIVWEEKDTIFKNLMEIDHFGLENDYKPRDLDNDYKKYLGDINAAAQNAEMVGNAITIPQAGCFFDATLWHRENVLLKTIWEFRPDFPQKL
ncbi:MAG: hypothetical protein LBQ88_21825 [Treponema sp.]|jgi:hypothetical protein|nr:hypothetical protein [Treponema sp.]